MGTVTVGTLLVALGASLFFGGTWPSVPLLVEPCHVGVAFGFTPTSRLGPQKLLLRPKKVIIPYTELGLCTIIVILYNHVHKNNVSWGPDNMFGGPKRFARTDSRAQAS